MACGSADMVMLECGMLQMLNVGSCTLVHCSSQNCQYSQDGYMAARASEWQPRRMGSPQRTRQAPAARRGHDSLACGGRPRTCAELPFPCSYIRQLCFALLAKTTSDEVPTCRRDYGFRLGAVVRFASHLLCISESSVSLCTTDVMESMLR